ncbi:hypothetical protein [Pelagibacterium halotolerans]|uniref:hypothetical protein n=1 Tax=Pelagibacterium halotolerans TaxID=531813 RepID=UPI00384B75C2
MADFNAAAPFQYRMLMPLLASGVGKVVPWLDADVIFAALEVAAWMALVFVALRGVEMFCPEVSPRLRWPLALTVLVPVAMHLIVPDFRFPSTFQNEAGTLGLGEWRAVRLFRYVYDLPAAVFTLATALMLVRFERRRDLSRFAAYLGVFALATLNRETAVFMIAAFFGVCRHSLSPKTLLMALAAQIAVFVAIYGGIVWLAPAMENPHASVGASEYENHLMHNLALFASPLYLLTYFARFSAGLYLPVLLLRQHLSPVLGRIVFWYGLPLLASAILFGRLVEQRVVVEVVPLIWLAAIQAITAWVARQHTPGSSPLPARNLARASDSGAHERKVQTAMDRSGSAAFVIMLMFLAFMAGAMVMQARAEPSVIIPDPYRALEALKL